MKKLVVVAICFALLLLLPTVSLLAAPPAAAAARRTTPYFYIPPQHRVRVPGACAWECTESVTRALGYTSTVGLAAHKKATTNGGAWQSNVKKELDARKIPYVATDYKTYDFPGLKKATNAGHGVLVGVQTARHKPTATSGHEIVVVGVANNESRVTFWNPSAPDRLGTVNAGEFKKDWFGNTLYILPPSTPSNKK